MKRRRRYAVYTVENGHFVCVGRSVSRGLIELSFDRWNMLILLNYSKSHDIGVVVFRFSRPSYAHLQAGIAYALLSIMKTRHQVAEDLIGEGVSLARVLAFAAHAQEDAESWGGEPISDAHAATARPPTTETLRSAQ